MVNKILPKRRNDEMISNLGESQFQENRENLTIKTSTGRISQKILEDNSK